MKVVLTTLESGECSDLEACSVSDFLGSRWIRRDVQVDLQGASALAHNFCYVACCCHGNHNLPCARFTGAFKIKTVLHVWYSSEHANANAITAQLSFSIPNGYIDIGSAACSKGPGCTRPQKAVNARAK